MKLIDAVLLFQSGVFLLFGLPHILSDDGNMEGMGFDYGKFMPMKGKAPLPVPEEINLLLFHICAILGSAQLSLVLMGLMGWAATSLEPKKLAVRTFMAYNVLITIMQFHKPSGTGKEGSPPTGPLPVIVALSLPAAYASFAY